MWSAKLALLVAFYHQSLSCLNSPAVPSNKLPKFHEARVVQCLKWAFAVDAFDPRWAAELEIMRTSRIWVYTFKPIVSSAAA